MSEMPFLLIFGITGVALFLAGYIGKIIKVPMLLLYIGVGIVLAQFIHLDHEIKIFGEIGIVILFFFLGLEFNISRVLQTAKKIWVAGLLDVTLNFLLIFIVLLFLGFDFITSFSIAGVTYASSSAITTKIIIDEHRIANSETEFILGLMVFEDIVAPVILAFIAAFQLGNAPTISLSLWILLKIFLVVGGSIVLAVLIRKQLAIFIEKYLRDEILTLLVIGFVILASGFTQYVGLSEALGAFLVGIIVAESGKSFQIESIIIPIRDITVSYFFLIFGSSIVFSIISQSQMIWTILLVIVLSIVGKILTGVIGGRIYGLGRFKALISGLSIVNRGEFSIAISQYISIAFSPIASIYILIMAILGIISSVYSKRIAKFVYPKKPVKKVDNF